MVTNVLRYTSDIDYEYPETPEQASGYVSLLSELRSALDAHAKRKGESNPYQLSVIQFARFSKFVTD
jgi:GH18 family chitinase